MIWFLNNGYFLNLSSRQKPTSELTAVGEVRYEKI